MALRYIFMGSPPLAQTILAKLCKDYGRPELVVTQTAKEAGRGKEITSPAVAAWAKEQKLPLVETPDVNEASLVENMKNLRPDLLLVAAFGQLLKEPVLTLPRLFCLNVHASLLPKYRGAAPIQWALLNNERETGVSIQRMVKKLDAGDILHVGKLPILPDDTSESLLEKLADLGGTTLLESLAMVESGNYNFTPQDPAQVTFAPKIEKQHGVVNWTRDAVSIANQVRAMRPWPIAETLLGKDRLKLFKVELARGGKLSPGQIETDHRTFLYVGCGESTALALTEIQLENRKRLEIKGFLSAYRGQFPFKKVGA